MRTSLSIAVGTLGLALAASCVPPPPPQVAYGPPAGATAEPPPAYAESAEEPDGAWEAAEPDAEAPGGWEEPAPPEGGGSELLTWLAGSWKSTNHQFQFYGDGHVRRSDAFVMTHDNTRGSYTPDCVSSQNEIGTVRHEGEYLIMSFDANSQYYCGERSQQDSRTVRYHIEWHDNPYYEGPRFPGAGNLQLKLRDIDCTQGDMWCVDLLYPL